MFPRFPSLQFFSCSFSVCANSSDFFVCFRSRFQRFILCLDIRLTSSSWDIGTVEDRELLFAMPSWDYCEFTSRCCGFYDARRFLEMAMDGYSLFIYDRQGSLKDTFIGADARRWGAMSRSRPGVLRNLSNLDMPFVCYATEVDFVRRMWKMLGTNISSDSDEVDLSCCCFPRTFRSL